MQQPLEMAQAFLAARPKVSAETSHLQGQNGMSEILHDGNLPMSHVDKPGASALKQATKEDKGYRANEDEQDRAQITAVMKT